MRKGAPHRVPLCDNLARARPLPKQLRHRLRLHQLARLVEVVVDDGVRGDAEGVVDRRQELAGVDSAPLADVVEYALTERDNTVAGALARHATIPVRAFSAIRAPSDH